MKKLTISLHRERIALRYQDIRHAIGESVRKKDWNPKNHRVKNSRPDADQLNAYLNRIEMFCTEFSRRYDLSGETVTPEAIAREFQLWKTGKPKVTISFIQFYEDFNKLPRLVKGRLVSGGTVRDYKSGLNILKKFMAESRMKSLRFEDITHAFYDRYVLWLMGQGYELNTIGNRIKNLITVMNAAYKKEMHTNIAFKSFHKPRIEKRQFYLSIPELRKIHALDLSRKPTLDRCRDCFLVQAFSSLRFSEFRSLTPENIETVTENGETYQVINILPTKTADRVNMPLHPVIADVLKKYDGAPPKPFSNQKMNAYLKEVCKAAGIDEMVQVTEYKGGERQDLTVPKYNLISTHTARRSFFTNSYKMGMSVYALMTLSGKKTQTEFYRYICIEKEQAAMDAKDAAFFRVRLDEGNLKVV